MDGSEVHDVGAHHAREHENAFDRSLRRECHLQQQIGDECDGDLGSHGVVGGAEEAVCLTERKNSSICQRVL